MYSRLSYEILDHYNSLEPESKKRNVISWRPVVIQILKAFAEFEDEQFKLNMPRFYLPMVDLLQHDITTEVRVALYTVLKRCSEPFLQSKNL